LAQVDHAGAAGVAGANDSRAFSRNGCTLVISGNALAQGERDMVPPGQANPETYRDT